MKTALLVTVLTAAAFPALAEGDADAGESLFGRCKSCHSVANGDTVIVRGGRTGPNLYGIMDLPAGTADFRYSAAFAALAETGLVWSDENFVAWVSDPQGFLDATTGGGVGRTQMSFKLRDGAEDIAAYLRSLQTEQ